MRYLTLVSCLSLLGVFSPVVQAEDEFGCKVLLCAASENPSWRGVRYCVPVMAKLYSMMKAWSFSWPVCSSAGTGSPGYEQYDYCPEGWTAVIIGSGLSSGVISTGGTSGQHVCQKQTQAFFGCDSKAGYSGQTDGHLGAKCIQTIPRPLRSEPYYFDIPDHKRVYFSVR